MKIQGKQSKLQHRQSVHLHLPLGFSARDSLRCDEVPKLCRQGKEQPEINNSQISALPLTLDP
jgi:hypothetical protein